MEHIYSLFAGITSDPNQLRVLITISVAIFVFTLIFGFMLVLAGAGNVTRKRLRKIAADGVVDTGPSFGDKVAEALSGLAPIILPKDQKESSNIQVKLQRAGFRSPSAVFNFYALKTFLALLLPGAILLGATWMPQVTTIQLLYAAMIAMGLGVFGPNAIIEHIISKRQDRIRRGFADALDMLVVCVEAGLGFDLAFRRVAEELKLPHPDLADELAIVNGEIRAGVDRVKALRQLADRTGLEDIRGFVALLSQSIRLGTSVAETLRIYSADFRDKRLQAAEEQAAKIGTKMIFPLVFCFFPCFFIVSIGPVILRVLDVFSH